MEISGKYCNDMGCSPADKEAVDLDQGEETKLGMRM